MIYIFGSSGMLGTYMKKKIHGAICFTSKDLDISKCEYVDIIKLLKDLKKDDVVINCAGIIPHSKKNDFWKANCDFPILLGNFCRVRESRFIHISTDCVFDGSKGNYIESDIHDSKTEYGMSKSMGEDAYGTIITTSIIGEELKNKYSLLEWVRSNKGKSVNGFGNHLWNGVTCWQLSKIVKEIIEKNIFWIGKKHIFSPNKVSKAELVQIISDVYNLDVKVIVVNDLVTKNMTLSSEYETKFDIPCIYDQIFEMSRLNLDSRETF